MFSNTLTTLWRAYDSSCLWSSHSVSFVALSSDWINYWRVLGLTFLSDESLFSVSRVLWLVYRSRRSLSLSLSFGSRPAFRLVGSLRFCLNIALFCILIWAVQTQTQIMHRQKAHCSPIKRKDAPNRLRQQITIILINSLKPSLLSSEYKLNEIVYSYPFRFEWIKLKQKYWVDMKSRNFLIRLNWANKS